MQDLYDDNGNPREEATVEEESNRPKTLSLVNRETRQSRGKQANQEDHLGSEEGGDTSSADQLEEGIGDNCNSLRRNIRRHTRDDDTDEDDAINDDNADDDDGNGSMKQKHTSPINYHPKYG